MSAARLTEGVCTALSGLSSEQTPPGPGGPPSPEGEGSERALPYAIALPEKGGSRGAFNGIGDNPADGSPPKNPITVGFVLVPGFALMSYACAIEPLRAANRLSGRELYRWWHAAPGNEPVTASNGVAILPDRRIGDDKAQADLVLVCAGGNPATFANKELFAWLRRLARRGITIGGISGGPYILANAGLLEGRRCTLHWEHVPSFQETFPGIDLSQSLFEIEDDRIT